LGNSSTKLNKKLVNFYYVLDWSLIILNLYFIFRIIFILRVHKNETNKKLMENLLIMRWCPILQVICSIPATIHRVYNLVTGIDNFTLGILHAIFDSINGFLICFVFLLTPEIKKSFINCIKKIYLKDYINVSTETVRDSLLTDETTHKNIICFESDNTNINNKNYIKNY
jgi:hypothetical protein